MKQPKMPGMMGGSNKGQIGPSESFAHPANHMTPNIVDMESLKHDIGEASGFQTSGYLDKKGTPYGEGAKFNLMPPGMDIANQEVCDIRDMPMKTITESGYAGDGGFSRRDVKEV